MRNLYDEFFRVPKHAKIREKVMLTRVAMSVAVIVMCLFAMGVTAYAYFTHTITSDYNIIKTANFKTAIEVFIEDSEGKEEVKLITSNNKTFTTDDLKVGKFYTVKIKPAGSAKTGFVVIKAEGGEKTYHTCQLGVDESVLGGKTPDITFEIMITDETQLTFTAHWGTSSDYLTYINTVKKGDKVKLIVNGVMEPPVSDSENGEENSKQDGDGNGEQTPPPKEEQTDAEPADEQSSEEEQTDTELPDEGEMTEEQSTEESQSEETTE